MIAGGTPAAASGTESSGTHGPLDSSVADDPLPTDQRDHEQDRDTCTKAAVSGAGASPRVHDHGRSHDAKSGSPGKQRRCDDIPVSAAAAADVLAREREREKDGRIAFLEKEMDAMERDFRQELDRLSQSEAQTAVFWQSKHSLLNQQFLRTDTELRLLRGEADAHAAEREELRQGVDILRRDLRERDDEIRRLRAQVRGLKDFVSTSTRTDDQTSDEVFGDGMTRLGNGLQNWVITNYRRAKIDLSKASDATLDELGRLVPTYRDLIHTSKVHLLQSIVSRILVEAIFGAYYVGLSEAQTLQFQQMEHLLSSLCPSSDEPVNQWRSSTLALLRREAHHLHESTDPIAEPIVQRIMTLLSALTAPSAATRATASEALRVLVKNAVELARLLVVQKAKMRIYMPPVLPPAQHHHHQQRQQQQQHQHQGSDHEQEPVHFEPDTMEDVGGEDEDALAGREVACVVFPGVVKHGDENGGNAQFRNVIARAKVLCRPG
ncbi:hypothetical protein ESCO_001019 [Escovopsis weberi]|uniref:Uncharacterized protein n=1 Tax=Escovopsis weberi TaxID=150374 RepID=A0A0M8MUJ3_ESCWE|nr:hypothetical protein ESCO_001019 [Escovopsis weberi]